MMKINKDKSIGRVLFIVEGGKTEFSLLKKIFCDILDYNYIEKRRGKKFWPKFQNKNKKSSKVAVINTEESHISYINDPNDFLDELFGVLVSEYDFPIDNAAIFYLFDRDPISNNKESVEKLINSLKNPYDNDDFRGGLLLLSYPAIESYLISSFLDNASFKVFELGSQLKNFCSDNKYMINNLSCETIIQATNELMNYLKIEGIDYNIDKFSVANQQIFNAQEDFYLKNSKYKVLSLLSIAFLELGIISEED